MHTNLTRGIIRVPLFPLSNLENVRLPELSDTIIMDRIKVLCSDEVIEAIYISSPEFAKTLEKLIQRPEAVSPSVKLLEIWLSFVKYYTRICTRPTPYGLMASVGIININARNSIQKNFTSVIDAQLDNGVVAELSHKVEKSGKYRSQLNFFPNPSIYRHGSKLKYYEITKREGVKEFALSKIDRTSIVNKIIEYCRSGKKESDIITFLYDKYGTIYSLDDIKEFLSQLIINQILISNLSSSCTRTTLFSQLVSTVLSDGDYSDEDAENIVMINHALQKIRKPDWSANKNSFLNITDRLDKLKLSEHNAPFHLNLIRSFDKSSISAKIVQKIYKAVELIASLNENNKTQNLEVFRLAFTTRYEDRLVPLSEILDDEIGIGYPVGSISNEDFDGCLENIKLPNGNRAISKDEGFSPFYIYLLNQINKLSENQGRILELSSSDLNNFSSTKAKIPATFSIFCSMLGTNEDSINNGDYKVILSNNTITTAASPMNRFSVSDSEIALLCKEIIEHEQNFFDDKIVAEVVHSPNSRLENITYRAVTREYEIPLGSRSNHEYDKQIPLEDILVCVSLDEVKLVSKKHRKEIIPRISNNHVFNAGDSLSAYQFLGELQLQNYQVDLLWRWGPLANLDFLPRVVLDKNIVCSLATWRVTLDKSFFNKSGNISERLSSELASRGFPKFVSLRQRGDNLLLIDIEDISCLLILTKLFIQSPNLIFHEYLGSEGNSIIKDEHGKGFASELIIPYVALKEDKDLVVTNPIKSIKLEFKDKREFFPGEEFLYLKIYCAKSMGQMVLMECLFPIFIEKNESDTIFFIRYQDPEDHIRLRIRKENNGLLIAGIYNRIKKYVTYKAIYKIQYDTYHRELDRYTILPYAKTELIFSLDSKIILQMISFLDKANMRSMTWVIAIKNIYSYLSNFGMTIDEMISFSQLIKTDLFSEMKLENKEILKSLNLKMKTNHTLIDGIIKESNPDFRVLYKIIDGRDNSFAKILTLSERKKICRDKSQLFSYIHMSINRLFASDQRLKEAVSYDLLHNYLLMQSKMNKGKQ